MHYSLVQTVAPSVEPITIDEARDHLRMLPPYEDSDPVIQSLIAAARRLAESVSSCLFVTQTWKMSLDCFPCEIEIPYRPVQSITSITYRDGDGAQQTLSSALYQLDKDSFLARIRPAYNEIWPSIRYQMNAVELLFVGGWGLAADVPQHLKQAMLLLIGHFYENREATIAGVPIQSVPMGFDALIGTEKVYRV